MRTISRFFSARGWVIWSLVGFGLVTWVGFLIVAIRVRRLPWFLATGFWFLIAVVSVIWNRSVPPPAPGDTQSSPATAAYGGFLLITWMLGIAHSLIASNRTAKMPAPGRAQAVPPQHAASEPHDSTSPAPPVAPTPQPVDEVNASAHSVPLSALRSLVLRTDLPADATTKE
jgi:hypothetical protein